MKLDPTVEPAAIANRMNAAAEEVYGKQRASELVEQIEHLSRMMASVARQELDLTDEPLPGPRDRNRGQL